MMMAASRVSRKTMKKMGTEKTPAAMADGRKACLGKRPWGRVEVEYKGLTNERSARQRSADIPSYQILGYCLVHSSDKMFPKITPHPPSAVKPLRVGTKAADIARTSSEHLLVVTASLM